MSSRVIVGDCRVALKALADESVHCVVTSPPYFGLRDYKSKRQIGLELTPKLFIEELVGVFREVKRVLRRDGTVWLNMGDSYAGSWGAQGRQGQMANRSVVAARQIKAAAKRESGTGSVKHLGGIKGKNLMGMPWRLAFALQDDGWYIRQDIIWSKPNPMPESVEDRCTKSHEYLFLLSKSPRYFYDNDAIREPHALTSIGRLQQDIENQKGSTRAHGETRAHRPMKAVSKNNGVGWGHGTDKEERQRPRIKGGVSAPGYEEKKWETRTEGLTRPPMTMKDREYHDMGRNKRSVWQIPTAPFREAHFATFPPDLVEPCILAGTSAKGCCSLCGAPHRRIKKKRDAHHDTGSETKYEPGSNAGRLAKLRQAARKRGGEYESSSKTLGWQPSCACKGARIVPCVVLDPFFGAGTTALVADRLQRDCVGVELNPEYAEMAIKRLTNDGGMFSRIDTDHVQNTDKIEHIEAVSS